MRGLVIKDSYILIKQVKFFGLLMLIMAAMPNTFTRGFAIMYASMLPITLISFDEQAKWDYYAAMMPYKKKELVLSKYITGIVFTLVVCVVTVLSILVTAAVEEESVGQMQGHLKSILMITSAAIVLMALNLPIIFKMGAERGRMVYMALTVLIAVTVVGSVEMKSTFWNLDETVLLIGLVVVAIVTLLLSMAISIKVYSSKRA